MTPGSILDHIGLKVSDYDRSKAFFQLALQPLGIALLLERGEYAGFGFKSAEISGRPQFFIMPGNPSPGLHIAFRATSRLMCDAFHQAALEAGGSDNGPPGLRPRYHSAYYGAFILDPDGHNIEAVCHSPE